LSQSRFMNRQILYLRPDPARVVVRPFKPATEPRDLNPTDKTRANHIVGRVLQLDAAAAAQRLSDVVENFEGRHRNLLDIFETRAAEMEEAFEPHAELNKTQRRLIGAYFLRIFVRGVGFVQSKHRPAPGPVQHAREWLSIHLEDTGRIGDRSGLQSRTAARRRGHNRTRQQLHIDGANASFSRRQR